MSRTRIIKLIAVLIIAGVVFFTVDFLSTSRDKIYSSEAVPEAELALVFGAGLNGAGEPSDVLNDRLYMAAKLFETGKVKKILVSGDNRFSNYNEPEAMKNALVKEYSIPEEVIISDYAGRRTYDSCARAKEVFAVDSAILVTQYYHLPRALYLCNKLGVNSVGVSATLQSYVKDDKFKLRELLAIGLAIWEINFNSPEYLK